LAQALGEWDDLAPLVDMSQGGPNTSEKMRARLRPKLGESEVVPLEILRELADERQAQVQRDVEMIAETYQSLRGDAPRLGEFLQRARDDVHLDPNMPIRYRPRPEALVELTYTDKTSEIVSLAEQLIRIPSVTACSEERLIEVRRAATFIFDYARDRGLPVRYFDKEKYPALLISYPGQTAVPVMLSGHFDVVPPDPDDSQFEPHIEGDYLVGRGAADMKTVVATYLVWMKDTLHQSGRFPPVNLLLVGNEENGEIEPMGTPHALKVLGEELRYKDGFYAPRILIAGERTGEQGKELWGEICTQNRGVMRFDVIARGQRGHSGTSGTVSDLTERLLVVRAAITGILARHLTLSDPEGWHSQVRFPFIQVGTPGMYNVTADTGLIGVEVRPIPQDDLKPLKDDLSSYCSAQGLELTISVMENGIVCDAGNPYLSELADVVRKLSKTEPKLGRKLPGTSARFAPEGQGIVWGQSGIGPHAANERHFIPSILPYYQALAEFGIRLQTTPD
jgi:acetylornithine deacetylase/succinyl-diaminopimelate desuccinylase-like protein